MHVNITPYILLMSMIFMYCAVLDQRRNPYSMNPKTEKEVEYILLQYEVSNISGLTLLTRRSHPGFISIQNSSAFRPTFIHIPKTGGTSIETALLRIGIHVGKYAFASHNKSENENYRNYPVKPMSCIASHVPPLQFVPMSLSVIRHPIDRLMSEYCYRMTNYVHPVKMQTCKDFNADVKNHLKAYYEISMVYDDCHWVSQWPYFKSSQMVMLFQDIKKSAFWDMLSSHFNTTAPLKPNYDPTTACDHRYLPSHINFSCLDATVSKSFYHHFEKDFAIWEYIYQQTNYENY